MPEQPEERLERVIRGLQAGRRLKLGPRDAAEREAIMAAARMAALKEPYPRMTPAFRRRLQQRLADGDRRRRLLTRREALLAGASAATAALGVGAAYRVAGLLGPARAPERAQVAFAPSSTMEPQPGAWFDAGPLAALPEGQAVHFRAGAVPAVLFREGASVRALSGMCTHLPCELGWNHSARTLDCPCHPQSFDMHGQSVGADYPLPTLPGVQVKVEDGRVMVLGA